MQTEEVREGKEHWKPNCNYLIFSKQHTPDLEPFLQSASLVVCFIYGCHQHRAREIKIVGLSEGQLTKPLSNLDLNKPAKCTTIVNDQQNDDGSGGQRHEDFIFYTISDSIDSESNRLP